MLPKYIPCACGCGELLPEFDSKKRPHRFAQPSHALRLFGQKGTAPFTEDRAITAFWAKVDKSGDCWMWTASKVNGYGQLTFRTKHWRAHRLAWTLSNGPIPPGIFLCHTCDAKYPPDDFTYRACVNPAHLFLGTAADNQADMARKGRGTIGDRNTSRKNPDRVWSKIPAADVLGIRALYAAGGISMKAAGAQFGVSESQASRIIHGTSRRRLLTESP